MFHAFEVAFWSYFLQTSEINDHKEVGDCDWRNNWVEINWTKTKLLSFLKNLADNHESGKRILDKFILKPLNIRLPNYYAGY